MNDGTMLGRPAAVHGLIRARACAGSCHSPCAAAWPWEGEHIQLMRLRGHCPPGPCSLLGLPCAPYSACSLLGLPCAPYSAFCRSNESPAVKPFTGGAGIASPRELIVICFGVATLGGQKVCSVAAVPAQLLYSLCTDASMWHAAMASCCMALSGLAMMVFKARCFHGQLCHQMGGQLCHQMGGPSLCRSSFGSITLASTGVRAAPACMQCVPAWLKAAGVCLKCSQRRFLRPANAAHVLVYLGVDPASVSALCMPAPVTCYLHTSTHAPTHA
jgi:hypothetical protein